jgi:hypothetical protein
MELYFLAILMWQQRRPGTVKKNVKPPHISSKLFIKKEINIQLTI